MVKDIDKKVQALRRHGVLNAQPEAVTDELFAIGGFFDASDLVQVKYEMLRRVHHDGQPVAQTAAAFGFSRPSFYQIQQAYLQGGLAGLLPKRRGPRGAHKVSVGILEFIQQAARQDATLKPPALARLVQERFGLSLNPRTVARALAKKNA